MSYNHLKYFPFRGSAEAPALLHFSPEQHTQGIGAAPLLPHGVGGMAVGGMAVAGN